jgi:hypothetical protein
MPSKGGAFLFFIHGARTVASALTSEGVCAAVRVMRSLHIKRIKHEKIFALNDEAYGISELLVFLF